MARSTVGIQIRQQGRIVRVAAARPSPASTARASAPETFHESFAKATLCAVRRDWLGASAAALEALAAKPGDSDTLRLLAYVQPKLKETHPALAARIARLPLKVFFGPRSNATAGTVVAPEPVWKWLFGGRGYFNSIVSMLVVISLLMSGLTVRRSVAYFTYKVPISSSVTAQISAPSNLSATADYSLGVVSLTWTLPTTTASTELYVSSVSSTAFSYLASVATGTTTYTYIPPSNGTYYFSAVAKYDSGGGVWASPFSTSASATYSGPQVTLTPSSGSTVSNPVYVTATFDVAMDTGTASTYFVLQLCNDGGVCTNLTTEPSSISPSAGDTVFSLSPNSGLVTGSWYIATVSGTWQSQTGAALGASKSTKIYVGSGGDMITNVSVSPSAFSPRSGQTLTISPSLAGTVNSYYVTITVMVGGGASTATSGCKASGTSFTWNGKDDAGPTFVDDGTYSFAVTADTATCAAAPGTTQTASGYSVKVAHTTAGSLDVSPPSGRVTLLNGESTCITADGGSVPDGLQVEFAITGFAGTGGSRELLGTTSSTTGATVYSRIGEAATGCTAPSAGSGKAVAKLSITSAATTAGAVSIRARMVNASGSNIDGTTSVNDPPDPPSDLQLAGGSIIVQFRPSGSPTVAGYYVLYGTAPDQLTTKVDIGNSTYARITQGIVPGTRYYVAVQAYDKLGQVSSTLGPGSVVAPADLVPSRIELDARSVTPGAPLRQGVLVTAKVYDAAGALIPGAPVAITAPAGVALSPQSGATDTSGSFTTTLTVTDPTVTSASVAVSSGAISSNLVLALAPLTPTVVGTVTPTASVTPFASVTVTGTATEAATAVGTVIPTSTSSTALSGASATPSGDVPTTTATPVTSGGAVATATPLAPTGGATPAASAGTPAAAGADAAAGTTQAGGTPSVTAAATSTPAATATPAPPTPPAATSTAAGATATSAGSVGAGDSGGGAQAPAATISVVAATVAPAPSPTQAAPTAAPSATSAPAATSTSVPPTAVPPTSVPPTSVPPTTAPPTSVPPTSVPPTSVPPTSAPATSAPSVQNTTVPASPSASSSGASSASGAAPASATTGP
jgi:hypothetical protein